MLNIPYIEFVFDDEIVKVDFSNNELKPTTTVLQYLRNFANRKGTKEGCAEGDCGACTVVLAELSEDNTLEYKAVNSCILFLPSIHGKQLITVEDLECKNNLHPIQSEMYKQHASQCGFCTPGFEMSLLPIFKSEKKLSSEEIRHELAGNLCRCTGYRPIVDVAEKINKCSEEDSFSINEQKVINLLNQIKNKTKIIDLNSCNQKYYLSQNLSDTLDYIDKNTDAIIVSGGSDIALRQTKNHEHLAHIIDISQVKELNNFQLTDNEIIIGAGLNLNKIQTQIQDYLPALSSMLYFFGSTQIRNVATLGGNIGSASPIGDSLPILLASGAEIVLQSVKGKRKVLLQKFITGYRKTVLKENEIITHVIIPRNKKNEILKFYKNSKRNDLDISSVSAAFRLNISDNLVNDISIYYGGMAATPINVPKTEEFLIGKIWNRENVKMASEILKEEMKPISDARAEADSRTIMAGKLLVKFWSETLKPLENE